MILTCPSCATRYFVGDDAVPPGGRTVRCAACSNEWRATAEASPLTLAPAADGEPGDAPLPRAFRAKAAARRQTRQAVAAGVVWAALCAVFVAVALAAVLFRVDVVRAFPRANAAYAAVKMPVNPTGLALEGVQGGPGLENGRQVLAVNGLVRNVETAPRAPAFLRVSIFDKGGHRTASQLVRPGEAPVAAGEARAFRAVFYDPPLNAAEFGVDFALDAPPPAKPHPAPSHALPGAHPASAHAAPAAALPAAAVHEAAALPADSPYALAAAPAQPAHAAH